MQYLYLTKNKLIKLNSEIFSGLVSLVTLHLSNNLFKDFDLNNLKFLSKLQYLYLEDCAIETIRNGSLNSLRMLIELSLRNNKIDFKETFYLFNQTSSLNYLYLYDNELETIKKETFHGLKTLLKLDLQNNT